MSADWLPGEIPQPAPVLRLLVELPFWPRVFFGNLRDLAFPRRLPPLGLRSAPAAFWPDVFVQRPLPWNRFLQSCVFHVIAFVLLIGFTRFFALQPQVVARPTFDHAQVIYYQASEYLPPLDTRSVPAKQPKKADPELSRQPIISVPPEADNRSQTIVTPPNVKLKHDVALPNIVAWSDKMQRPRLAVPPVPLTPAAARRSPSDAAPELAHSAKLRGSSAARPACFERGLSGARAGGCGAAAEYRRRIQSSAGRSEHRPRFGDCACSTTFSRRTTRLLRIPSRRWC